MSVPYNIDFKKLIRLLIKIVLFTSGVMLAFSIYLIPFIVAFIISTLAEPIVKFLISKLKISRKVAAFLCVVVLFSLLTLIVFLVVSKIISELYGISQNIRFYYEVVNKKIENFASNVSEFLLPLKITRYLEEFVGIIFNTTANYLDVAFRKIINIAIYLPNILLFLLVVIISTYFMISDKEIIVKFINKLLPSRLLKCIYIVKKESIKVTNVYIKSQLIMATITAIQIFVGLYMLRVKNICSISLLLYILDLLPLFGVGLVIIPWGTYEVIFCSTSTGIGILLLYISVVIVRNLVEPRILGSKMGVHPLIVLISTYVGFKIFDVMGLILGPVVVMFMRNIIVDVTKVYSFSDIRKNIIKIICKN